MAIIIFYGCGASGCEGSIRAEWSDELQSWLYFCEECGCECYLHKTEAER